MISAWTRVPFSVLVKMIVPATLLPLDGIRTATAFVGASAIEAEGLGVVADAPKVPAATTDPAARAARLRFLMRIEFSFEWCRVERIAAWAGGLDPGSGASGRTARSPVQPITTGRLLARGFPGVGSVHRCR